MRRILGNVAALLLALAVSLVAAEALLRAVVTLPLRRLQPEVRYEPHAVRRFTLKGSQRAFTYGAPVEIDERGFRSNGPHSRPDHPGPTVLALGDSFTFGLGVRDEETWPAQLEQLQLRSGAPVSVINAGTISYGVFQEMDLLRSVIDDTSPQVVVHGLYWNDFMNTGPPPSGSDEVVTEDGYFVWDPQGAPRGLLRSALSWTTSRSAMLFSLRTAADRFRRRGTSGYETAYTRMVENGLTANEWNSIGTFYRELLALGEARGFQVFVVIMPVDGVLARGEPAAHPYVQQARAQLEALPVPYLDGFDVIRASGTGASVFLPQGADSHLNPAGYRILASALASRLREVEYLH